MKSCNVHFVCRPLNLQAYESTELPLTLTLFSLGFGLDLSRTYPSLGTALFHTSWTSTWVAVRPLQLVTRPLDRKSTGFDWLGTRSNHTGHRLFSSSSKIHFSTSLQGSFLDHVLRKLCRTASLSVNPTTLKLFHVGHQMERPM